MVSGYHQHRTGFTVGQIGCSRRANSKTNAVRPAKDRLPYSLLYSYAPAQGLVTIAVIVPFLSQSQNAKPARLADAALNPATESSALKVGNYHK